MEFKQYSISLPKGAKYIFDKMRGNLPFSTYLQFMAFLWQKNTAAFQYLQGKMANPVNRDDELETMLLFFEMYEERLRQKGALPANEIQEEGGE